jgi:hypothetical protein
MPCLKDAELMRYLDESMPSAAHEAVQRHLHGCMHCAGTLQRLVAVGNRVDTCLAALAGSEDASPIDAQESLARLRHRIHDHSTPIRKWALAWATAVVATCIVVVALGIYSHLSTIRGRVKSDVHTTTAESPQTPMGQPLPVSARPIRVVRGRARLNESQAMADYLPLDGGPMQMGVVVRVTLPATAFARFGAAGSGNLQADVLVGEDGIAHAIRLVPQE